MQYTTNIGAAGDAAAHELTHVATALLGDAVALALAIALGGLLARWLRRRGLHWSWSALPLPAFLPLAGSLGTLGPAAVIALAVASLRGRRWHRGDLDTGQDLGRIARERLTPAAVVRRRVPEVRRAASRTLGARVRRGGWTRRGAWVLGGVGGAWSRRLARVPSGVGGTWLRRRARMLGRVGGAWSRRLASPDAAGGADALRLGRDDAGRAVTIPFAPDAAGHALVVGATGSGKTVTQTLFAVRAIEQGRAVVAIDPKGDAGMRRELRSAAISAGCELIEWTPEGPTAYNPYARGGETEIADRLLAGERFTEPHYLRQAQRYLGHAIRALRACDIEVSLRTIVEVLEPAALEQLLRSAPEERAANGHSYLDSLTARQLRDLAGIRDRLAILAESDVGRWLDAEDGGPGFDLLDAVRRRAVVYIGLEADSRPLLAQMLGAAIVQDLQSTVAALQAEPTAALVLIDEFAAVSAEHVVALFGRARSAGISLLLGTQEIADLRLPGRERTLEQVMGNLSLLIAHRQVVPASAELVARLSGARGAWRVSRSNGGRTTRTRAVEPCLAPEQLTGLGTGCAAVIPFGSGGRTRLARVEAPGGEGR